MYSLTSPVTSSMGGDTASVAAGGAAANTMFSQLKIYSDTDSDMKDGTDLNATTAGSRILRGVMTSDANGDNNAFYYATAKTLANIFGKLPVDITSEIGKGPQPIVTGVSIAQDTTDPYSAKVSLTNLRADATVYVLQSDDATDNTGNDANNDITMVAGFNAGTKTAKTSMAVTAGTKEVVIPGAVDAITAGHNHYMAVVVPTDAQNYAQAFTGIDANTGIAGLKVTVKLSNVKITSKTGTADAKIKGGVALQIEGIDQFGNSCALNAPSAALATKSNITADTKEPTITWGAATAGAPGQITIAEDAAGSTTAADVDHKYSVTTLVTDGTTSVTKTFTLTCTAATVYTVSVS